MARIGDGLLKNWLDGSVVKAAEYKQEREILRVAINDNYDRLVQKYDKTEVDALLASLESNVENQILDTIVALNTHKNSDDHDARYHTQEQISNLLWGITGSSTTNLESLEAQQNYIQLVVDNLNTTYSTDAERIAAINDVINQFQIADGDLNTLIQNKANKSDTYTKAEVNSTQQVQDNRLAVLENGISATNERIWNTEVRNTQQDGRLASLENTVGNSYTKPEVDTALNLKADKSGVYTKAEIDIFKAGLTVDSEVIQARLGSDGTAHANLKNRLDKMEGNLIDKDRVTQNLVHGVSVLSSALNSPVELEIQGRTLTSLGNSNLEGAKNYVLADKRTKIRAEGREGTQYTGVAKFVKSASVLTKADFVGKVAGSVTENANKTLLRWGNITDSPSTLTNAGEIITTEYTKISTLNATNLTHNTANTNGNYTQHLFSFNIIEQIERKLGRIPSDTVAGKVQWIKDNVNRLTSNWHGWGSSVGGNGAVIQVFRSGAWTTSIGSNSHSNSVVTKLSYTIGGVNLSTDVDANGFVHVLAYTTNPSDGTTPSQLNTDFVECEVELKATAVLDTRPILTRVANFEGKVSADLTSNPHVSKKRNANILVTPTDVNNLEIGADYSKIAKLDGTLFSNIAYLNGEIAQNTFSFDLIQEIERSLGRIPKSTLAEKVQWVKDNVQGVSVEWSGFGSSVGGNKATLTVYRYGVTNDWNNDWKSALYHTNGTVTKINNAYLDMTVNYGKEHIDTNGMVHYLAYANASDGVTASTINTDYIELQITLKQGVTLFDPILPLYEVDATEYGNILTTWDETNVLNRYPKVQGVQHLQNVAVIGEGENLLPPFSEWASIHANATTKAPYELELNATLANQPSFTNVVCLPNTQYFFNSPNEFYTVSLRDSTDTHISNAFVASKSGGFTTPSNAKFIRVITTNATTGKYTFTNPMLTLGNVAKPFVPRNPSYLFAPVKLGQIGDKKDSLFTQDGAWYVRKQVEKDVVLDGSLAWTFAVDDVGFKIVQLVYSNGQKADSQSAIKYNGLVLRNRTFGSSMAGIGGDYIRLDAGYIFANLYDTDTGFGETYTPSASDIQRYFNGWKYTDGTTWQSVTGNGQTATASVALSTKPTDYTPYKLSYVLATPQLVNVNDKVEGALSVSGSTQVEVTSGVVVREKVTPILIGNRYYLNYTGGAVSSWFKNKADKLIDIYKGTLKDTSKWAVVNTNSLSNGNVRLDIDQKDFDTSIDYFATYKVLDRHLFTTNATEVKSSYAGSLKDQADMNTEQLTDLKTQTSINSSLLYRLLVQAKANGWSV